MPFYIDKENEWQNADIRVMIFGQETNDWGDFNTDIDLTDGASIHKHIKPILDYDDKFYNGGECWSYGGQFWNGFSKFRTMFEEKFSNKKIKYIWNNIVKIGKSGEKGFPPGYIIYETERKHFSVIKDELQIIKPNVVLFLTGPNYDGVVTDNFRQLKYTALSPFSARELSKVRLSETAQRIYH
ncbi:hypothetical protein [Thermonema sp.]|uniref:hypothetical protein n=1 Tax=Thermonema sp. TaxID=2231181 RepID=UPI00258434BE|nr:hypothetical protein [Thermonema sp.]